ncbi:ly6/PLAUR domain-containing protein 1 isoform X1 [Ictalurus punctatus]|uniref:Ly6/PLAUR domain-containing protein 1 isoform X1 n=1 Tax=Ictalurus punctatus TaxID=7998 RepID=A0A2D0Q4M8_ICTPU|nr:ly6/PLAUR domain-containing protein 1 isoform X1 [Ictalurus punctatus]
MVRAGCRGFRDMLASARRTMPVLGFSVLTVLLCLREVGALQIQCYQCEEIQQDDCSSPEFIVNCTVNVQDMCQKEVLIRWDGVHYRKSCASSGACLIASSGYQQFCTGKLNSVCITCCNTPLCNGPRQRRRPPGSSASPLPLSLLLISALLSLSLSLSVSPSLCLSH